MFRFSSLFSVFCAGCFCTLTVQQVPAWSEAALPRTQAIAPNVSTAVRGMVPLYAPPVSAARNQRHISRNHNGNHSDNCFNMYHSYHHRNHGGIYRSTADTAGNRFIFSGIRYRIQSLHGLPHHYGHQFRTVRHTAECVDRQPRAAAKL